MPGNDHEKDKKLINIGNIGASDWLSCGICWNRRLLNRRFFATLSVHGNAVQRDLLSRVTRARMCFYRVGFEIFLFLFFALRDAYLLHCAGHARCFSRLFFLLLSWRASIKSPPESFEIVIFRKLQRAACERCNLRPIIPFLLIIFPYLSMRRSSIKRANQHDLLLSLFAIDVRDHVSVVANVDPQLAGIAAIRAAILSIPIIDQRV